LLRSGTDSELRWKKLHDPDVPAPDKEPGLDALFDEIRLTVSQEAQIIQAVFPIKEEVMKVFLQRVFAQVVSRLAVRLCGAVALNFDCAHRFNSTLSICSPKPLRKEIWLCCACFDLRMSSVQPLWKISNATASQTTDRTSQSTTARTKKLRSLRP
jgi:hypothetical protein